MCQLYFDDSMSKLRRIVRKIIFLQIDKFGNIINMKLILVDKKVLNLDFVIKTLKACHLL